MREGLKEEGHMGGRGLRRRDTCEGGLKEKEGHM